MCTNSDGTTSNSNCTSYETNNGVPLHLANLDSKALTYCNPNYAYGGVCNSNSAWAMDAIDFEAITGSTLSMDSCYNVSDSTECGYGNDLIDNGVYEIKFSDGEIIASIKIINKGVVVTNE